MKKLIVFMIAAMAVISASAQMRTSRTFTKTKSRTEWIIRVGPSFNKLTGYDKDQLDGTKVGGKVGFDIDAAFNKSIGESGLYWGMEFGIGTRGTKLTDEYEDYKMEVSASMYNIKYSPFTIGYKFAVTDDIKIDPHVGLYALYDFAISSDDEDGVWIDDFDGKFDAGLQAGVGFWYKRFNIDFMYQFGFVNADPIFSAGSHESYLDGGKTSNFLIRLGYSF